jgi:hypothetical protein
MASTINATITMSDTTVESLSRSGYTLQAFQVVQTNDSSTMPTIWFMTTQYSRLTTLMWTDQAKAYTSATTIAVGTRIAVGFTTDIASGQVLVINSPAGTGAVNEEGVPGTLGIQNTTGQHFTVGASATATVQGNAQPCFPLSAAPLYGEDLKLIELTKSVLFVVGGSTAKAGTVEGRSQGPGVMVDFTGAVQRELAYDINTGWSWDGGNWAIDYPPNTDLPPILTVRSEKLVAEANAKEARFLTAR